MIKESEKGFRTSCVSSPKKGRHDIESDFSLVMARICYLWLD